MIKKNFKKILTTLCLGLCLTQSYAYSDQLDSFDCSDCIPLCPTASLGVDFLYWKPCVDDMDYAAILTQTPAETSTNFGLQYKAICPDWSPGVRAFVDFPALCKGFDLRASYTYVKFKDSHSTQAGINEQVIPTNVNGFLFNLFGSGSFDSVHEKVEGRYQTFDVLLRYPLILTARQKFAPFFGVTGLSLKQDEKTRFINEETISPFTTIVRDEWESDYFGVGLKLGTEWGYNLCDGLSLFASVASSIVTGDSDNKSEQTIHFNLGEAETLDDIFTYHDDSCCQIVPGYHIQAGFGYETYACGCDFSARIGYEFVNWFNLSNPRRFDVQRISIEGFIPRQVAFLPYSAISTQTNTRDFGMHGVFAGLDIKF